jgi:STE24 endopeptidase
VHERRFGLSSQTAAGWLADRAKGLALSGTLSAAAFLALVGLARALPSSWPAAAAPLGALAVAVLGFLSPVVLEPVFNRFAPLGDAALAERLRGLAAQAGVPIREVLVADASRRTRKPNAYVSGLGRTRRLVLFDTLLAGADADEVAVVAAHELAHRRERHVARGTALGAAGAAAAVVALWGLLEADGVRAAAGVTGAGDPRVVPLAIVLVLGLELLAAPAGGALSRAWERVADRVSLELTGDVGAFRSLHRRIALENLADLAPPGWAYLLFGSHPTPPERLAAARAFEAERSTGAGRDG